MPGKKPPSKDPQAAPGPDWQVILEEMRSQNSATIEAVQGLREEVKRDIAELRQDTNAGFQVLESAVRQNSTDIRTLQEDVRQNSTDIRTLQEDVRQNSADIRTLQGDVRQNSADIRTLQGDVHNLTEKVDNLSGLEARVAALERRRG
jgi:chromosome segregation ATPase